MSNTPVALQEKKNVVTRIEKKTIGSILLSILLAIIAVIQLYPLVWLVLFSFKTNKEIFGGNILGLPEKFLWSNYKDALTHGKVGLYFMNSTIVTIVTIVVSGIFAAMAAYAIVRMRWKLRKPILMLFLMGLMIPIHAALLPLFMLMKDMHLMNTYFALILPYIGFALPMAIFILSGFLESIPIEMEEAACLDGCTIYQTFFKVIFPLLKPCIATISIFTFLSSWNELMFAVTFISKQEYKTLTVGIMSMVGRYATNWGPIGAGLVISLLPTLIIYILLSDQVQKSLTSGALK